MNLLYGEVVDVFEEEGVLLGRIRVAGALKKIPLGLLTEVVRGDKVLICDGMAISKVAPLPEREMKHVPRDSRETD